VVRDFSQEGPSDVLLHLLDFMHPLLILLSPLVFLDRERKADGYPWLEWKVRVFATGAAMAVGGMVLRIDWLVTVAIVVLVGGFMIRFLPGGTGERQREEE